MSRPYFNLCNICIWAEFCQDTQVKYKLRFTVEWQDFYDLSLLDLSLNTKVQGETNPFKSAILMC